MFHERLFKQNSSKTNVEKQKFLNSLNIITLTNQQSDLCEKEIWETDFSDFMKSMKNSKITGNDWLTKVFYNFLGWTKHFSNGEY